MNYMRELNAFRDWAMINRPSTGAVALWHMLMSVNNMTGWQEWFSVPNQTLQLLTGLSRQGIDSTRNALIQKGLIEYKKGISNQAGKYRMISFYGDFPGNSPVDKNFECQNLGTGLGTVVGMDVGTLAAPEQAQPRRSGCTLYKLKDINNKTKNNNYRAREKDGVDNLLCPKCGGKGWYVVQVPFNNGLDTKDQVVSCDCSKKKKPGWADRIGESV